MKKCIRVSECRCDLRFIDSVTLLFLAAVGLYEVFLLSARSFASECRCGLHQLDSRVPASFFSVEFRCDLDELFFHA